MTQHPFQRMIPTASRATPGLTFGAVLLPTHPARGPSNMTLYDTIGDGVLPSVPSRARSGAGARASVWTHCIFAGAVAFLLAVQAIGWELWQLSGTVVPWDSKNHFYPMFRFLGDALRHGTLPLWNPYHFGGYPAIADPQSLVFTPSMLLFALLAPDAGMAAFDAVIAGHILLGGVGVLGLARRWRWHPAAGVLAALVFMLGGAASSRLQHTGMIISYGWFPLALWSLGAALDRRSLRLAIVAGLFATLMALGRDQVAYLLCITLAATVLRQAAQSDGALRYLRGRAPTIACAGLVALACMLVPILLTMQFLHDSNRPGIAYGMALEGSLDPVNLLTLFSPDMFGSLDPVYDYWGPGAATLAGDDWTDRSIDYLFIGTLSVVLIVWQGFAGGRALERGARSFLALFVAALIYALGRHSPFFGAIFDWVPGVALYRRPADATFLMNVALAFLSGDLLHRYIAEGSPAIVGRRATTWIPSKWGSPKLISPMWIAPALTSGLVALLVGAGLAFAHRAGHFAGSLQHVLCSAALASVIGAMLILCRTRRQRSAIASLLVVATAGQLVWRNSASPLNAEPASTYSAYDGLYPDQARGLAVLRQALARDEAAGGHPRVEIMGLDGSWQNAAMMFKLQDTAGYNPLRIAAYERATGVAESANDLNLRSFPDTFRGYNSRLATLLGLDYLVLDRSIADLPRQVPRPRASLLFAGTRFYVYHLDGAIAPRAYVATHVLPVDSDAEIESGTVPDFTIGRDALVEADDMVLLHAPDLLGSPISESGVSIDDKPADASGSSAAITTYGDNQVSVAVEAASPGVLVLHDIDYPGWIASVDGHPAPVLRVNLLFRGVEVSQGRHLVTFAFHPLSPANLVAAAAGLVHRTGD